MSVNANFSGAAYIGTMKLCIGHYNLTRAAASSEHYMDITTFVFAFLFPGLPTPKALSPFFCPTKSEQLASHSFPQPQGITP